MQDVMKQVAQIRQDGGEEPKLGAERSGNSATLPREGDIDSDSDHDGIGETSGDNDNVDGSDGNTTHHRRMATRTNS